MIKRKFLGQHFLNSISIAEFIVNEAQISKTDVVFEIGTGLGMLTPLLCKKAQKVISVDADERLIKKAKFEFSTLHNLVLESGDGFKKKRDFTIFVIVYLPDVPNENCGNFTVWPESHRFFEDY